MRRKSLFTQELSRSKNLPDEMLFLSKAEDYIFSNQLEEISLLSLQRQFCSDLAIATMLFCYSRGSSETAFILSKHWDREVQEAIQSLEEALSSDSSDLSDEEFSITPRGDTLSNSLHLPQEIKKERAGRAYFLDEENDDPDTQNRLMIMESEPTPHLHLFQEQKIQQVATENATRTSILMQAKLPACTDTPQSSAQFSRREPTHNYKMFISKGQAFQIVGRRVVQLIVERERSQEFRRFLSEELIIALKKTRTKLRLNTGMLVSLFEFHFSDSFAVFDEKGEEKEESTHFVTRLLESEKVRLYFQPLDRTYDFTLHSLAALLISQNLKQEIWKKVVDSLEVKISERIFGEIAFTEEWQRETREFLIGVLSMKERVPYDPSFVVIAIRSECCETAYLLVQRFWKELSAEEDESVRERIGWALTDALQSGSQLEFKLWLCVSLKSYFDYRMVSELLRESPHFGLCKNPIKVCVLYVEFLLLLQRRFTLQARRIQAQVSKTKALAAAFIEHVDSERVLRSLLRESDHNGRPLLGLLYHHSDLLNQVEQIILQIWNGPFVRRTDHFLRHSSFYVLFNLSSLKLASTSLSFSHLMTASIDSEPLPFNFYNVRHSARLKYHFHQLFIFFLALYFQSNASDLTHALRFNLLDSALGSLRTHSFFITPLLWTISPIQLLFDFSYFRHSHRRLPPITPEAFLQILLFIASLIFFFQISLPFHSIEHKSSSTSELVTTLDSHSPLNWKYMLGLIGGLLWIRVVVSLRLTRSLGPMVRTIFSMLSDVVKFLALESLVLVAFACVGSILFYDNEHYHDLWHSALTLISSSLGEFDYSLLQDQGHVGQVFLTFYLYANLVIMLNLLIAVLSSTYGKNEQLGVGLYLRGILDTNHRWEHHHLYNFLTFRNPPLNLLNIFPLLLLSLPCCKCCKCKHPYKTRLRLLRAFQILHFLPIAFISLLLFVFLSLLFFLPLYLKLIFSTSLYSRKSCRVPLFIWWLFFFPLLGLVLICKDSWFYFLHLFQLPSRRLTSLQHAIEDSHLLSFQHLLSLLSVLQDDFREAPHAVPTREVVLRLRSKLNFSCDIPDFAKIILTLQDYRKRQSLLSPTAHFTLKHLGGPAGANSEFLSTQVYNSIKFFLYRNSSLDGAGVLVCHPLHLAHAIRECITNARIRDLRTLILQKRPLFPHIERNFSDLVVQERSKHNVSTIHRLVKKALPQKAKKQNRNFEHTNRTLEPRNNQSQVGLASEGAEDEKSSSGDSSSFHLGDKTEFVHKQLTLLGQGKHHLKVPETVFTLLVGPLMQAEEQTGFERQSEMRQKKKRQMQRFRRSVLTQSEASSSPRRAGNKRLNILQGLGLSHHNHKIEHFTFRRQSAK